MKLSLLLLLTLLFQPPHHYRYHAADGSWVRRPHLYKRHPNAATLLKDPPTGTCRDGSLTFAHTRRGACSHHGGLRTWS